MSQLFTVGGQSIGALALVLPMNIQCTSFRIDWFDLLAVQETIKSLLQHRDSKISILWHSGFFMVQLSHLYMTTRKTIALTIEHALIIYEDEATNKETISEAVSAI